ncbi:signal peptidase I [Thermovibrio ammonificans]|jgi:signal peptidase I|uniref:Signal peptidase I n=1 Tax=Thermovibrio ammonificans (strain DSM 15698 / JCM 12110 / HB-1) TaxID=648996 RepID=E8T3H0_THEA1|nr:signal peptidase I [Thermovibrio ammonificans]ADU96101.1 signal peptidase I [Thermovibrio ammonificans HB-1]
MNNKLVENLKSFAIALVLALIIRTFIVQSFHIPSGSMIPTLLIGDFILVDKVTYRFRPPERGDVVVFHFPLNREVYYVKRIVGVPGDRIQVKEGKLYINGKPCKYRPAGSFSYYENGVEYEGKLFYEFLPRRNGTVKKHLILKTGTQGDFTPVFVVPKGEYFMMGDNRNNSYDSRYWGFVKGSEIVGIARIIFFSWDPHRHVPRFNRIFKLVN